MKKIMFVLILCAMGFSHSAEAQIRFGAGANYYNDLGVSARANFGVSNIELTPKVTYFFSEGASVSAFDLDGEYDLVTFGEENPLYILAGLGLIHLSSNGISNTDIGVNAGAGIEIQRIYFEIRYSGYFSEGRGGDVGFAAGYYF